MHDSLDHQRPGREVTAPSEWEPRSDVHPGQRVEGTDGLLGTLREHVVGSGPEHAYLVVEAGADTLYVPDRLIRETRGSTIELSLPIADVRANASVGAPPLSAGLNHLPTERG